MISCYPDDPNSRGNADLRAVRGWRPAGVNGDVPVAVGVGVGAPFEVGVAVGVPFEGAVAVAEAFEVVVAVGVGLEVWGGVAVVEAVPSLNALAPVGSDENYSGGVLLHVVDRDCWERIQICWHPFIAVWWTVE
jgi:hypothetical protein